MNTRSRSAAHAARARPDGKERDSHYFRRWLHAPAQTTVARAHRARVCERVVDAKVSLQAEKSEGFAERSWGGREDSLRREKAEEYGESKAALHGLHRAGRQWPGCCVEQGPAARYAVPAALLCEHKECC